MKPSRWALLGLVLVASFGSRAWAEPAATLEARRPNIIFVLTDDQGYGDLSCHGNPILKTPNIDRLHAEGVRFTDFHVSPTCSPTRSALMTGRHEFKNGVTHTILERERLTLKATTLAQVLQSAGYTTGIFGKWHLGDEAALSAGPARLRRSLHPRLRRHRPELPRQLRRRPRQHLLQPGHPPQRQVREDQRLLHRRLFRPGPALDRVGQGQEAVLLLPAHQRAARPAASPSRGRETLRRPGQGRQHGEVLRHDRQH